MGKHRPPKLNEKYERRASSFRGAWNRLGKAFGLRKEEVEQGKRSLINPYRILRRKEEYTVDSVRYYIECGGKVPREYDSMADYLVDREIDRLTEIARLEQKGSPMNEIRERVGENWY